MRGLILTTALGAAALAGCYTTGDVGYSAQATYSNAPVAADADGYAATPDLVTVQPGVQVVADYDEPVFFVDGFYWRFNSGYWYRSNNYAYGWGFYDRPPVAVLRIDRPYAYAHYRPAGYVARTTVRYRPPAAIVTDHRTPAYGSPAYRGSATYAPPAAGRRAPPPAAAPGAAPAARAPAPPPAAAPVHDKRAPAKDVRDHRH